MGLERTPSGRLSDAGCAGVGATCMQPSKAACITWESNTGHIVGNAGYYHETTGAPEGRAALRRVAHLTRRAGSAKSGRSARKRQPTRAPEQVASHSQRCSNALRATSLPDSGGISACFAHNPTVPCIEATSRQTSSIQRHRCVSAGDMAGTTLSRRGNVQQVQPVSALPLRVGRCIVDSQAGFAA